MTPDAGAVYVVDNCYLDFVGIYRFAVKLRFFGIRNKSDVILRRLISHKVGKSSGLRSARMVVLDTPYSDVRYPDKHRRIRCRQPETRKTLEFLPKHFALPAFAIAKMYKCHGHAELFNAISVSGDAGADCSGRRGGNRWSCSLPIQAPS